MATEHVNTPRDNLILAQAVLLRGQLANQWTILASQLTVMRVALKNFFDASGLLAGPVSFDQILEETREILDFAFAGLQELQAFTYADDLKDPKNYRLIASEHYKQRQYMQRRETIEALLNYTQQAQELLGSRASLESFKDSAFRARLAELLAVKIPHIPAWKEEALGHFFLTLARAHRAEVLAASIDKGAVKSELHFLYYTIIMNDYECALKVLTMSVGLFSNCFCSDCLDFCLDYQGEAMHFPVAKELVQEAVHFLEQLAAEVQYARSIFSVDLKEVFNIPAPEGHPPLLLERLSKAQRILDLYRPFMERLLQWLPTNDTKLFDLVQKQASAVAESTWEAGKAFSWASEAFIPVTPEARADWPWWTLF